MTRYYFHLHNDVSTHDLEGKEFADLGAAMIHARRCTLEMAAASLIEHGRIIRHHRLVVADGVGSEIAQVTFGDVIDVRD